jgi:hypothetical protein
MSIQETRLNLAVRLASRALRASPEAPLAARLAAFRDAYAALATLDTGDDAWTDATSRAAWELTEPAYPQGGAMSAVTADLAAAHAAVIAAADRPAPDRPTRPRRDA